MKPWAPKVNSLPSSPILAHTDKTKTQGKPKKTEHPKEHTGHPLQKLARASPRAHALAAPISNASGTHHSAPLAPQMRSKTRKPYVSQDRDPAHTKLKEPQEARLRPKGSTKQTPPPGGQQPVKKFYILAHPLIGPVTYTQLALLLKVCATVLFIRGQFTNIGKLLRFEQLTMWNHCGNREKYKWCHIRSGLALFQIDWLDVICEYIQEPKVTITQEGAEEGPKHLEDQQQGGPARRLVCLE